MHLYAVRLRSDHRGVDLISDALPFGRLVYGGRSHRKFLTSPIIGMSNQKPAITTMKRITSVAMALTALFGLAVSGCEKKTSDRPQTKGGGNEAKCRKQSERSKGSCRQTD